MIRREIDCIPEDYCIKNDRGLINKDERPGWCPLKEAPKKLAEEKQLQRLDGRGNMEAYGRMSDRYAIGYNACIDEILKECDKNEAD